MPTTLRMWLPLLLLLLGLGTGLWWGYSWPRLPSGVDVSELATLRAAQHKWQAEKERLEAEITEAKKPIPLTLGNPQDWQKDNHISQLKSELERLQKALELEKKRPSAAQPDSQMLAQLQEVKKQNHQLEQERDAMRKQLNEMKPVNKTAAVTPTPKPSSPAPIDKLQEEPRRPFLTGKVTIVDPTGLMMISLGKEVGVKRGDRFELFRPGRERAKLGTIVVVETWANEAGCAPEKPLKMATEVGDEVVAKP